jgi:HK97 family phage major capsid protein
MPNAVLERMLEQRSEQIATMDAILGQVDGRDLVDAERGLLESARQRIAELDAQIKPLEEFEQLRAQHDSGSPRGDRLPALPRRADMEERAPTYASPGAYLVDYIRAVGYPAANAAPDAQAAARVAQSRAVVNNVTGDLTGVLPTPIVGAVVNLIDTNRPLISSLGGAMALGGIPGTTFTRPKITQHTQVGLQAAEKTELASQKLIISPVSFTKATYGGTVDVSRQAIDWTSPGAWDIIVRDLANVYSIQTETVVAAAFKTAATGTAVPVATDDLKGWADALYAAAAASYQAAKRMPDRIWCSLDVWAALGSLVDIARLVMPPSQTEQPAGDPELGRFRGDVIGLPRIVVPTFPSGTCIVGPSSLYEVYEEVIGLLSVVEPTILGVTVAYGGYIAFGSMGPTAFVPLTAPAGMLTIDPASLDDTADQAPASKSSKSS